MLSRGKRGLGFLLAGVLFVTMPMGALASDVSQEESLMETAKDDGEETGREGERTESLTEEWQEEVKDAVIDLEREGYVLKLTDGEQYEYTGEGIEPEFVILRKEDEKVQPAELEKDTDYTAEYQDNIEVSADSDKKPTLIVEGVSDGEKGYKGTLKISFEIVSPDSGSSEMSDILPEEAELDDKTVAETDDGLEEQDGEAAAGIGRYAGVQETDSAVKLGSTVLKSSSAYSKISLSWSKVPGAEGYEVHKSKKKSSGFKLAERISDGSLSYADGDAKLGQTYYYRVRAYCTEGGRTAYGEWSPVKAQKKQVAAPKITYVKAASGRVKIAWKKTGGASGYVLYRCNSEKGKYKKTAVIKKGSKVSYTDKKVLGGKVYYYKVRAYRQVKKKKYYGLLSAPAHNETPKKPAAGSVSSGSGWRYVNGYKLYYDKKGKLVKDVSKIIGKQSSYVIKVNKKKNCVTVYAKDGKNGYIIPVKAFPCSAGKATPITTARTPSKYRWHELNGNCYGQWCTRIKQGYLFHSVMYGKTKNTSLSVSNYNKLGKTASHGCIRLRAGDAKWIYDNCRLKTKVIIYNSSNPGPLGKPSVAKLPKWHRWDPTDPTARVQCSKRGCH